MNPILWPTQKRYTNSGFNDDTAITYSSQGSRAVAVTYGAGGGTLTSRVALIGGSFSWKFVFTPGTTNVFIGLDTSPVFPGLANLDFLVDTFGNVKQGSSFVDDISPVSTTAVYSFEISGTTLTLKKDGVVIHTFTASVTQPMYLHISAVDAGTGVSNATYTGSIASGPTPPAAPTIVATAGHKRNHIQITYPSGANGVSIYRSTTPGGQDFSIPLVTEYRLPYFEDTGLTNGQIYYYKAKATVNGIGESSASSEVSATPTNGLLPSYSSDVALIVGSPQVKAIGDGANYWFDRLNEQEAMKWGTTGPKRTEFESINGTISVTNGSTTVNGTGTTFLSDYRADGYIKITDAGRTVTDIVSNGTDVIQSATANFTITDALEERQINLSGPVTFNGIITQFIDSTHVKVSGTVASASGVTGTVHIDRVFQIYFINSDTSMTLWDAYTGPTESGRAHRPWWQILQNQGYFAGYIHYYDLSLSLYHVYLRTGNPYFLQLFRENADAWYSWSNYQWTVTGVDGYTTPRQGALAGLVLRALDGQSSYWAIIEAYTRYQYDIWVQRRINSGPPPTNWFDGVRDQAYCIQFAAFVAKSHPVQSVRDEFLPKALNGINQYFHWEMEQYFDRYSPRMSVFDFGGGFLYHYHQPFIDAIYAETAVIVHKLANDTTAKQHFLDYMATINQDFDTRLITGPGIPPNTRMRSVWYSKFNTNDSTGDHMPPFNDVNMDKDGQGGAGDPDLAEPVSYDISSFPMSDSRQANNITISPFGYAYYLTGNSTYVTQGNDRIDASYGDVNGAFADTFNSIATMKGTGKNFNESYRRGASYFAYRDVISPIGGGPDTTPPTCAITSPSNGATVSGIIGVNANASDNVGVVGVQFKLDGANLGSEDLTAPYSVSLNTTLLSNGSHTLSAVARDAAGNTGTAPTINITVDNTAGIMTCRWDQNPVCQ